MARKRSDTLVQGTNSQSEEKLFRGVQYMAITRSNWVTLDKWKYRPNIFPTMGLAGPWNSLQKKEVEVPWPEAFKMKVDRAIMHVL